MCIAILNSNNVLPFTTIENSFEANSDGTGFIWSNNNKLYTYKTLEKDPKKLYNKYLEIRELTNGYIILHFRIGTSGKMDLTNCHPFNINDNLAFVHNGIIQGLGDKEHSDTWHFNQNILKKLPKNFLKNSAITNLIEDKITGSKLLFLDNKGEINILNEHLGHWDDLGNWYSNYSYQSYVHTYDEHSWYSKSYEFEKEDWFRESSEIINGVTDEDVYMYADLYELNINDDYDFEEVLEKLEKELLTFKITLEEIRQWYWELNNSSYKDRELKFDRFGNIRDNKSKSFKEITYYYDNMFID